MILPFATSVALAVTATIAISVLGTAVLVHGGEFALRWFFRKRMTEMRQCDVVPKRIRFEFKRDRWWARATYGGVVGYEPFADGDSPEDALRKLADTIAELHRQLQTEAEGADPLRGSRFWESAFHRMALDGQRKYRANSDISGATDEQK